MPRYPLQFKAAILEGVEQLVLDTVEFQGPLARGQVLVKLCYSSICGKQIEEIEGAAPDPFFPHLLGHEGSGWVEDVGPSVTKVKTGDTVVLHWRKGGGIESMPPLYFRNDARVNAGWVTTFNEYAVVSENRITAIPEGTDMEVAALLGCAVTTGVGAVINAAKVQPQDTVAVFGCGGVGLSVVQAAHMQEVQNLVAVDINGRALNLAARFGATETLFPQHIDLVSYIRSLTAGAGATKVFVCTGDLRAMTDAIHATAIPGECFIIGIAVKNEQLAVEPWAIAQGRTIRGCPGEDSFPDRDIPAYLALHQEGRLKLDQLVTHVSDFADLLGAITVMRGDTPGRCLVGF